jgi:hypothetical protein
MNDERRVFKRPYLRGDGKSDPWRRLLGAVALRVVDDLAGVNYATVGGQRDARDYVMDPEGLAFLAATLQVSTWRCRAMLAGLEVRELVSSQPRKCWEQPWERWKWVCEQRQAGRSYASIAAELGISVSRAKQLARLWVKNMQVIEWRKLCEARAE